MKTKLLSMALALVACGTGVAAPVNLVSDPALAGHDALKVQGYDGSHYWLAIEGVKATDTLTAKVGEKLYDITAAPEWATIKVKADVSLEADGAKLSLAAGQDVLPVARVVTTDGKMYYLVKADRSSSKFMRINRYFAFGPGSEVLDHTFRSWDDGTYGRTESVSTASGDIQTGRTFRPDEWACRVTVVYLGESQSLSSFKVILSDGRGNITQTKDFNYMADAKDLTFPGVSLKISDMDATGIRATVTNTPLPHCTEQL